MWISRRRGFGARLRDTSRFLQIDALLETQEAGVRSRLLKGEIFIQSMATKEDGSPVEVRGTVNSERLPDHALGDMANC
jgi:hypothetical protein